MTIKIDILIVATVPRRARHSSAAKIAYSVKCAALRTKNWTCAIAAAEMFGFNQRNNGPMMRDVCAAENKSVDPINISASQQPTGSQYFTKRIVEALNR